MDYTVTANYERPAPTHDERVIVQPVKKVLNIREEFGDEF
jgi:hypothetical protein